jgi:hypothetical protein
LKRVLHELVVEAGFLLVSLHIHIFK